MELVSFKAEPHLVVILDQLVSRGIFISRSALIRFALWNKLTSDTEFLDENETSEDSPVNENENILQEIFLDTSKSH
ncbi:MAG: ribbon-helix-helix domain-containing protein [Candidatus Thorarchaeota archaeon]